MPICEETHKAQLVFEELHKQLLNQVGNDLSVGNDVEIIRSVLENPVFNSILCIQESLQELKKQLFKHPSILSDDFDISPATGELVLSVPTGHIQNSDSYEPTSDPEQNYEFDEFALHEKLIPRDTSTSSEVASPLDIPPDYSTSAAVIADAYAEALQAASYTKNRELVTLQLHRPEGSSLGFSVIGLRNEITGELGFFVQEVQQTGIAGRDGHLQEGDQILAIQGQSLDTAITHQQALGILHQTQGLVELVVARGGVPGFPSVNQHTVRGLSPADLSRIVCPSPQPFLPQPQLAQYQLQRTPSALSNSSRASDMVLSTEWAQVESVELINDGSGLGFGIIGGR